MDQRLFAPNISAGAFVGGTIGLVHEGDSITIDAHKRLLQLNVPDDEIANRRAAWKPPKPRYTRGVLANHTRSSTSTSAGLSVLFDRESK